MLKQRVVTAVVAGLVVLFVLLFGGLTGWRCLVWIATLAGVMEFCLMFGQRWFSPSAWFGAVAVTLADWLPRQAFHPFLLFLAVAVVFLLPVVTRRPDDLRTYAVTAFGAFYLAAGGASLISLRGLPEGWFWIWLFLVAAWMCDTAAYFVGRWVQGPKLLPAISPKKTVSGAVGGILGAVIGAWVFGALADPRYGGWVSAAVGLLVAVAGQAGDLVESAYKRAAGVKDSGRMLPGHGGVLDRIDSLLFAAPFALWFISGVLAVAS
ncbi:phosphatidate cytidylyltransferase [Alicyclobacillus vulcanalis]|uniref:Phosphatidate cytidylyltransferase n=1 Tax=Alicyclobacillus vulcanalis TaxID=252246 RepID=A0A1N7MVT6_9BACL|nr:phosphatidate cytidylyltransferase [Alicyclobacillus vulcanalis]SIS90128.1 phosphatidate cytidylyltransferase [Alicyclobacillus vulcanalis]